MLKILALISSLFLSSIAYGYETFNYTQPPLEFKDASGTVVSFPYIVQVPNGSITSSGSTTVLNYMFSSISNSGMPYTNPNSGVYFHSVDNNTLQLYVNSTLVHDWTAITANSFLLLEDNSSFLLQENGDKIIL